MGGASIALPLDAIAAANNPAGMAFVPGSFTTNVQIFQGKSSSDYVLPGNRLDYPKRVPIPEAGITWVVSPQMTVGVAVSGSGVRTDYGQAAFPVPSARNAKSNLENMEIIPNASWKPRPDLAVGVGPILIRQKFTARGVIAPTSGSLVPLPCHATQSATEVGVGLRLSVLWQAAPELSLGATYKSRTRMGKLDGYADDFLAYSEVRLDVPKH